jgi:hypothetical protein
LIRRSPAKPDEVTFYLTQYLTHAPARTVLTALVRVAGSRWTVESGFEAAKGEFGLDQYEVRSWTGWHRHVTLALLAHANLAVLRKEAVEIGGRGRPRRSGRRAAAAHRAGNAPPGPGPAAQTRRRPALVRLAQTPPTACTPKPLAHTDATP